MSPIDQLMPILKRLKMTGLLKTMDLRSNQAAEENMSYDEFLHLILSDEVERRDAKQLYFRLRRAQFEHDKTIEGFDFAFNPKIPKAKILELFNCNFIERKENVMLIGPAGVGKSHIAQALGHRACRLGYSSLYVPSKKIFSSLHSSRGDQSYDRQMENYLTPALLIIDDLGIRPLRNNEPEDLYEVIRMRYERKATIITSNRAIEEWYPLFGDALLASAAMDRLLHHATIIKLEGFSYRNPPRPRIATTGPNE